MIQLHHIENITIKDSHFSKIARNIGEGSAFEIKHFNTLIVENSKFLDNYSPQEGPLTMHYGKKVSIFNSTINNNKNKGDFGAGFLFRFVQNVYMENVECSKNKGSLLGSVI